MELIIGSSSEYGSFELGESRPAEQAINSYQKWKDDRNYGNLIDCFDQMAEIVEVDSSKSVVACVATAALAQSEFNSDKNVYEGFHLAHSVVLIHQNTGREVPSRWIELEHGYASALATLYSRQQFDHALGRRAGLNIFATTIGPNQETSDSSLFGSAPAA